MQADEVNAESIELGQSIYQLPQAASKAVVSIDKNRVELPALCIVEQSVQRWPRFLRSRHAGVGEFLGDLPLATPAVLAQPRAASRHSVRSWIRDYRTPLSLASACFSRPLDFVLDCLSDGLGPATPACNRPNVL